MDNCFLLRRDFLFENVLPVCEYLYNSTYLYGRFAMFATFTAAVG